MAALLTTKAEIRKLRKKLRQIENLERLVRPLDELEELKVSKKYHVRDRLQELLEAENSEAVNSRQYEDATLAPLSARSEGSKAMSQADDSDHNQDVVSETPSTAAGNSDSETGNREGLTPFEQVEQHKSSGAEVPNVTKSQDGTQEKSDKSSKKLKKADPVKAERRQWEQLSVLVSELDGHNDLVTSVSTQGTTLVSASRDTTVKVWDLEKGEETFSLGGHTETVTSVLILSPEETASLNPDAGEASGSYIISGSTDCTIKLWSLNTGQLIKSVYTFNPVTCLDYSCATHLLVSASDGGKVELWDLKSVTNVCSVRAHEESVTGVKAMGYTIITAGSDGLVMVHEIRAGSLVRVFVSEDVKPSSGCGKVHQRLIRSLTAAGQTVVFGDDAPNIKLLDWKKGLVNKAVNHVSEFASTDAVCLWDDLLFSSSFHLDQGAGYINVRSFTTGRYLASLDDEAVQGTERIVCLTCTRLCSGNTAVVSGGPQLKVWELLAPGQSVPADTDEKWVIKPQFLSALAQPAKDSEAESEDDDDDGNNTDDDEWTDDDDEDARRGNRRKEGGEDSETRSWCSIV